MKITQVVPIKESEEQKVSDEEYDKYICYLYDDNYFLVNTFETWKSKLVDGQSFTYYNKTPYTEITISISYDYTKIAVERQVNIYTSSLGNTNIKD